MPRHLWQRQVSRGVANVVRVPPYNQDEMAAMLKLIEARGAISGTRSRGHLAWVCKAGPDRWFGLRGRERVRPGDSLQAHGNLGAMRGLTNGNAREFLRLAGIL